MRSGVCDPLFTAGKVISHGNRGTFEASKGDNFFQGR